jgi:DNA-binding response OmpR family regulator
VLVADDNPLDAEMLSRRLQALGYAAETVTSGQDALAALTDRRFDLLLLDVIMPDRDGLATLRAIKSDAQTAAVPVLMISAVEEIPIVARCIELGAEDYLVKPVDSVLLRAKIQASLERRRMRVLLGDVAALSDAVERMADGAIPALSHLAQHEDELGRLARALQRLAARRLPSPTPAS